MSVALPEKLFTAVGTFAHAAGLRIEVAVPNFPTRQEAEDYARDFAIKLDQGLLVRNDGKAGGLFDEDPREVLDSQVTISRKAQDAGNADAPEPVTMTIAQLVREIGPEAAFEPVASHVEEDRI